MVLSLRTECAERNLKSTHTQAPIIATQKTHWLSLPSQKKVHSASTAKCKPNVSFHSSSQWHNRKNHRVINWVASCIQCSLFISVIFPMAETSYLREQPSGEINRLPQKFGFLRESIEALCMPCDRDDRLSSNRTNVSCLHHTVTNTCFHE